MSVGSVYTRVWGPNVDGLYLIIILQKNWMQIKVLTLDLLYKKLNGDNNILYSLNLQIKLNHFLLEPAHTKTGWIGGLTNSLYYLIWSKN